MVKVQIGSVVVSLNKNEAKTALDIKAYADHDKEFAQRSADIWMRSAPSEMAQERRKAAVQACGLSAAIHFA